MGERVTWGETKERGRRSSGIKEGKIMGRAAEVERTIRAGWSYGLRISKKIEDTYDDHHCMWDILAVLFLLAD